MDAANVPNEPLIEWLRWVIRGAVRALAVLMTIVIVCGVLDVAWELHQRAMRPPAGLLTIRDMLETFGVFMAVLIAIEIFQNIVVYLRDDVIHEQLVVATALMAICRKVIVMDFDKLSPALVAAIGLVVLATTLCYRVVVRDHGSESLPASHVSQASSVVSVPQGGTPPAT